MSLKKGGADESVPKALRYLLATPEEVKEVEEQSQEAGQWVSDILEYRELPTAMTPWDYRTLSNPTELKVQEVSDQCHDILHFCAILMSPPVHGLYSSFLGQGLSVMSTCHVLWAGMHFA